MRFLIGLILLAFPITEIWLLIELGEHYGWWLLFYLVVVGWLGLQLIKQEKLLLGDRLMQSFSPSSNAFSAGSNPIKAMLGSARNLFAGILLMIPGVMTDVIAVILLLIPMRQASTNSQSDYQSDTQTHFKSNGRKAANDDVIEGEFTEITDEPK